MKNILQYYYNLEISGVRQIGDKYNFYKDGNSYVFSPVERSDIEVNELYNLIIELNRIGIPCHSVILNVNKNITTKFNNKKYILFKKNIDSNDLITIQDIINFSNYTSYEWNYQSIDRTKWKKFWSEKMDYFEYQLSQIGRKYPLLCQMFSYYEGIVETGIQLCDIYKNIIGTICISHKRLDIDTTLSDFYNPLNFIIDYRSRDIAEYFKNRIIKNDAIDDDLLYCLENFITIDNDRILFLIRILFPSLYFDIYENVLNGSVETKSLNTILINHQKYEQLIKKAYGYISTYTDIPTIDWILKI